MSLLHVWQWYHHTVHGRRVHVRHGRRRMWHRYWRGRAKTGAHAADKLYHVVWSGLRAHHGLRGCLQRNEHVRGAIYVSGRHYRSGWLMDKLWGRYHPVRHGGSGRMILRQNWRTGYRVSYRLRLWRLMSRLCHLGRGGILPSIVIRCRRWLGRTCRGILLNIIRRHHQGDRTFLDFIRLLIHDAGRRIGDNDMHLLRGLRVGHSFLFLFRWIRSRREGGGSLCDALRRRRRRFSADFLLTHHYFFIFVFTSVYNDVRILANDYLVIRRGCGVMIDLVVISRIIWGLPRDLVDIQRKYRGGRRSVVAEPSARQSLSWLIYQIWFLEGHRRRSGRIVSRLRALRRGRHVNTLDSLDLARWCLWSGIRS